MTFRDQWIAYAEAVIPRSAGPQQIIEMRDSFYAGALSALVVLQTAEPSEASVDTLLSEIFEGCRRAAAESLLKLKGGAS